MWLIHVIREVKKHDNLFKEIYLKRKHLNMHIIVKYIYMPFLIDQENKEIDRLILHALFNFQSLRNSICSRLF